MIEGVHPTALVDPKATLGAGVRIGAFAVVGPEATLGAGAEIGHHCVLEGRVEIGERVTVGHGSLLGGRPQDLKFRDDTPSGVRIGADTTIREYVTVHRATSAGGWTEIGREYAGLVPFTRVGAYAYVGGWSRVNADVPPYVLAEGNPAAAHGINVIGLRRAGISAADRRLLQDAYRLLYRSGLSPRRAVERMREELPAAPLVNDLLDFIAGARRGICRAGSGLELDDESSATATPESESV